MIKLSGKSLLTRFSQPLFFILVGAIARIVPHVPNFTPVAAIALFGGSYLNKKQAFIVPLLIMVISDYFLGFDSLQMRLVVYGSFLATVAIGFSIRRSVNFKNLISASLTSSVIFFLTTNFAVWMFGSMYPKSLTGIAQCYTLALPFFRNTLLGDLFYTGVLFGSYEFLLNPNMLRELIMGKKSVIKL